MNLTSMQLEVATFVVDTLFLEIAPTDIELDGTLFYDGLGLDSIDALELALEISKNYGFEMSAEDEDNENITPFTPCGIIICGYPERLHKLPGKRDYGF